MKKTSRKRKSKTFESTAGSSRVGKDRRLRELIFRNDAAKAVGKELSTLTKRDVGLAPVSFVAKAVCVAQPSDGD